MFNLETNILQQLQDDINEWSVKEFPGGTAKSCIAHLKMEVEELEDSPNDLIEYADCLSLLLDAAAKTGYSVNDLLAASIYKLEINKHRVWGKPDRDGVCEHIR